MGASEAIGAQLGEQTAGSNWNDSGTMTTLDTRNEVEQWHMLNDFESLEPEPETSWYQQSESNGLSHHGLFRGMISPSRVHWAALSTSGRLETKWALFRGEGQGWMVEGVWKQSHHLGTSWRDWTLRGCRVRIWGRQEMIVVFKFLKGNQNLGLFWVAPGAE